MIKNKNLKRSFFIDTNIDQLRTLIKNILLLRKEN